MSRHELLEDLIATTKRVQKRNIKERMNDSYHQEELSKVWKPVVKSNEAMTKKIMKDLKPIKEEFKALSRHLKHEPIEEESEDDEELPRKKPRIQLADMWRRKVLSQDPDVDTSFGIRFEHDGTAMMGNQVVELAGNDIVVAGLKYRGTSGLWDLIADAKPHPLSYYTDEEIKDYEDLLGITSVMHQNFDPDNPYPRANRSWKWKHILNPIWFRLKDRALPPEDQPLASDESDGEEDAGEDVTGSGIKYEAYIKKNGKCYRVKPVEGCGLLFKPYRKHLVHGDGLFLKQGRNVYNGEGLLLGANSPFRHIPILGWIL